ncbi:hypothetical protein Amet_3132 [Alkaliphilus metalliredigens QYMF]|uniref:Preprotein translocase subunit SecB n=1 Tax=Alkaliphilus metalliredigens (strain QYMF) TaxID=293826 RepID=A6TSV3_ALKMQ|nr:hypothetical protein [Alkaliphilus metalliredigens]ABR49271.1 hypothetical protein Amet_3132 [Alkaliphilus metalliredigens QYMF]
MDSKKVLADFQLAGNRVSNFSIETKSLDTRSNTVDLNYDIDYNILEIIEDEERYVGLLEFIIIVKAKIKNSILFKINLKMEGIFIGNPKKLTLEHFEDMLELNGIATLSHLSRSYIISVSSLSGLNPPVKLPMINVHKLRELKDKKNEK